LPGQCRRRALIPGERRAPAKFVDKSGSCHRAHGLVRSVRRDQGFRLRGDAQVALPCAKLQLEPGQHDAHLAHLRVLEFGCEPRLDDAPGSGGVPAGFVEVLDLQGELGQPGQDPGVHDRHFLQFGVAGRQLGQTLCDPGGSLVSLADPSVLEQHVGQRGLDVHQV